MSVIGRDTLLTIEDCDKRAIELREKLWNLQAAAAYLRCKRGKSDAGGHDFEWIAIHGERLLTAMTAGHGKLLEIKGALETQLSLFE